MNFQTFDPMRNAGRLAAAARMAVAGGGFLLLVQGASPGRPEAKAVAG